MSATGTPPPLVKSYLPIRFSFTTFDLIKCRLWVINHHRMLLGITLFFSLLVPCMDLKDPKMAAASTGARVFAFVFTAAFMFCFITLINTVFQIILAASAKNRGLVGEHVVEISDDCLIEKTEFNASSYRWSAFHKLRSSRNFFFLYVTENNVIYVPKRCFSSVHEADQFSNEILRRTGK